MDKIEQLKLAQEIAAKAHNGQIDKAGNDYINHPRFVACGVNGIEEKTVAWLHDVIEDTNVTIESLKRYGFSKTITDAVDLMTHKDGVDYFDYVKKIKTNPIARAVKLSDLRHNMDLSRIANPGEADFERVEKYKKAAAILSE